MTPLLAARNLSKSYGTARVLDDVAVDVEAGEAHAIVGENGAGKSTLIKIIGGAVVPDAGEVSLAGSRLPLGDPLATRRRGVSIVYQEFSLVPELSVADNVFLGRELAGPFLRRPAMQAHVRQLLRDLGVDVDVTIPVRQLSVAQQQLVEIARALVDDAKVLMLDEPTASLTGREIDRLLAVVKHLRQRGLGILYVSHRLDEIFAIADRLTVLRDGKKVASTAMSASVDRAQVIRWMVGRDIAEEFPPRKTTIGAVALDVRGLSAPPRFSDVSFTIRSGEIVGLAGLVGAGRTSVGLAIAGAIDAKGSIALGGREVRFQSPSDAIARGVSYLTEDRKGRGLFPQMSTSANLTMTYLRHFAQFGVLDIVRERAAAAKASRDFDVRAESLSVPAGVLSGGNQQKMLLARSLLYRRQLLILDEPTRGVDVGARTEIYGLMNRLTGDGLAILMISSDLPELLGMSDRVIVMRDGRTRGELSRASATPEAVMALAAQS